MGLERVGKGEGRAFPVLVAFRAGVFSGPIDGRPPSFIRQAVFGKGTRCGEIGRIEKTVGCCLIFQDCLLGQELCDKSDRVLAVLEPGILNRYYAGSMWAIGRCPWPCCGFGSPWNRLRLQLTKRLFWRSPTW